MKRNFLTLLMCVLLCPVMINADEAKDLYDRAMAAFDAVHPEESLAMFEQSAELGNEDAQMFLASYYLKFDEYSKAFKWLKIVTERTNNPTAKFTLATLYMLGYGTTADVPTGLRLMKESANEGEVRSQATLGKIYDAGELVAQDYCEAFKWFKMAADNGDSDSQVMVGSYYQLGQCVDKNIFTADEWYVKAAEQGNKTAAEYHAKVVEIMRQLGQITENLKYEKVEGVNFDIEYDKAEWDVQKLDIGTTIVQDAYMFVSRRITDYVNIIFYDLHYDAEAFVKAQVLDGQNEYFRDANIIGETRKIDMWGNPAYLVGYSKIIAGVQYYGAVVTTNVNNGVMFVYTFSTDFENSKFTDVLEGTTVKQAVSSNRSFEETVMESSRLITQQKPEIADGLKVVSMNPDFTNKQITYTYKFTKLDKSQLNFSNIKKETMLAVLEEEYKSQQLTQQMLNQGYIINYTYLDKNEEHVGTISLSPEDYSYMLQK